MALGNRDISKIEEAQEDMKVINNELRDCWITFNYVVNMLQEWASETDVGNDVRENTTKLNEALDDIINSFSKLDDNITKMIIKQKSINEQSEY